MRKVVQNFAFSLMLACAAQAIPSASAQSQVAVPLAPDEIDVLANDWVNATYPRSHYSITQDKCKEIKVRIAARSYSAGGCDYDWLMALYHIVDRMTQYDPTWFIAEAVSNYNKNEQERRTQEADGAEEALDKINKDLNIATIKRYTLENQQNILSHDHTEILYKIAATQDHRLSASMETREQQMSAELKTISQQLSAWKKRERRLELELRPLSFHYLEAKLLAYYLDENNPVDITKIEGAIQAVAGDIQIQGCDNAWKNALTLAHKKVTY